MGQFQRHLVEEQLLNILPHEIELAWEQPAGHVKGGSAQVLLEKIMQNLQALIVIHVHFFNEKKVIQAFFHLF